MDVQSKTVFDKALNTIRKKYAPKRPNRRV